MAQKSTRQLEALERAYADREPVRTPRDREATGFRLTLSDDERRRLERQREQAQIRAGR